MILVAIAEPLLSRILPPPLMAELLEVGSVVVAPSPEDLTASDTRPLLADAEVLVTGWGSDLVDADVLALAPRLRAVAEYTLAMTLLSAKGVLRTRDRYRAARGPVDGPAELEGFDTYGLQVGIIGASTIGRRVIDPLAALPDGATFSTRPAGPSSTRRRSCENSSRGAYRRSSTSTGPNRRRRTPRCGPAERRPHTPRRRLGRQRAGPDGRVRGSRGRAPGER
jgi:hypothetical protein